MVQVSRSIVLLVVLVLHRGNAVLSVVYIPLAIDSLFSEVSQSRGHHWVTLVKTGYCYVPHVVVTSIAYLWAPLHNDLLHYYTRCSSNHGTIGKNVILREKIQWKYRITFFHIAWRFVFDKTKFGNFFVISELI